MESSPLTDNSIRCVIGSFIRRDFDRAFNWLMENTMSVAKPNGTKILLPRSGADQFWKLIHDYFAVDDSRKWKYLAMLALRENAGWPLDRIGAVFGHPKGHVTRCLARIKVELREEFEASPLFLDLDDELLLDEEQAAVARHDDPCLLDDARSAPDAVNGSVNGSVKATANTSKHDSSCRREMASTI